MPKLLVRDNEVMIRMYRVGHGDCFLLAMPRDGGGDPVYVLIDCGYKPGSPGFVHDKAISDIIRHIGEATDYRLDLVILTHEHQDHLNGIWSRNGPCFSSFTIKEAWLGWTEDPADPLANTLRMRHRDQILSLVGARLNLAASSGEDDSVVRRLDSLLALELGGDEDTLTTLNFAGFGPMLNSPCDPAEVLLARDELVDAALANSTNKQALKLVRDAAARNRGVVYLRPGGKAHDIHGTNVRAFVLGPPYDADLLRDEDPRGSEVFPDHRVRGLTFGGAVAGLNASAPFGRQFWVSSEDALADRESFFSQHYGRDRDGDENLNPSGAAVDNAPWRRIDHEWLCTAEMLALKLNTGVNNTSLVIGFELPVTKKVLLFVGDAQRGNWASWRDVAWRDGTRTVTARDLLGRTVVYKAGHHGSHNATLNGTEADDYANIGWLGTGAAAREFTAMIPAVEAWARKNKPPWHHPLPAIREALHAKAQGRVFQTDTDDLTRPGTVEEADWKAFLSRTDRDEEHHLYFDYRVIDE